MLATLSASLLNGKGRGNREALEGLHLGVGSLEGSLGLLSWDFHPCTDTNPSLSVGGAVVEVEAVPCGGGGGSFFWGASLESHSSLSSFIWICSSHETCLWLGGASPPPWLTAAPASPQISMGTISGIFGGSPFSPPTM